MAAGQLEEAARDAFLIGSNLIFRGELEPAQGWFARGGRSIAGRPERAEHGWLLTLNGLARMFSGSPAGAEPAFAEGLRIAQAHPDPDLLTMAQLGAGMCPAARGGVLLAGGLRLVGLSTTTPST